MKVIEKIKSKQADPNSGGVTIAFLGDSVTQGCFECYTDGGEVKTVYDYASAYSTRLREMLNFLYPTVPIHIINAGLSGDSASAGYKRLARDVLSHKPDLVVVSYGLNDCTKGKEGLQAYADALENIFKDIQATVAEVIFLTENCMNARVSPFLSDATLARLAGDLCKLSESGILKLYFDCAKKVCARHAVPVCDTFTTWEAMYAAGVDVTELLANKLNHPVREWHKYIAVKLIETCFS